MPTGLLTRLDARIARFCAAPATVRRLALAFCAALAFLPVLATLPVTDRDEARFVQASRQMIESGDPVDIRFQDEARYKKPVGIYWLQAVAMLAEGGGAEAPVWASRLPSFFAAIAAVVLVEVAGAPSIGGAAATLAALLFCGTLVLGGEARIAKTDAVLLALVLVAMAVLARLYAGRGLRRWQVFAFWISLGAAALVKGPVGPLIVGSTMAALMATHRETRWARPLADHWAIVAGLAVVLPWLVAISLRAGSGFWTASLGADLVAKIAEGQEGKGAPPGTYLALVWITFWPGSVLLATLLPAILARRGSRAGRFLLAWLVPAWLMFEAVPTKLVHYPLPLYPALALLVAAAWYDPARRALGRAGRAVALMLLLIGPILVAAALWLALATTARDAAWPALAALPVALALCVTVGRALRDDLRHLVPAALALLSAVTVAGTLGTMARVPDLWPSQRLATLMRLPSPGCPSPVLVTAGYNEPSLVVLTSRRTRLLTASDAAREAGLPCRTIAVEDRAAAAFAAEAPPALEPLSRVEGFAIGAGRRVGLTVYRTGPEAGGAGP